MQRCKKLIWKRERIEECHRRHWVTKQSSHYLLVIRDFNGDVCVCSAALFVCNRRQPTHTKNKKKTHLKIIRNLNFNSLGSFGNLLGDLFGQLLAWVSLAPMGIGAGFVTLILFRRDLHTVSTTRSCICDTYTLLGHRNETNNPYSYVLLQIAFFIGTLVNEISNYILKHWIREPRPLNRVHIGTEFGMPSSHAQFIWFFSTYVTLFIFIR